ARETCSSIDRNAGDSPRSWTDSGRGGMCELHQEFVRSANGWFARRAPLRPPTCAGDQKYCLFNTLRARAPLARMLLNASRVDTAADARRGARRAPARGTEADISRSIRGTGDGHLFAFFRHRELEHQRDPR